MFDLIEPHEPLPDCDCGDCARFERDRLRALAIGCKPALDRFEAQIDIGCDLGDSECAFATAALYAIRNMLTPNEQK